MYLKIDEQGFVIRKEDLPCEPLKDMLRDTYVTQNVSMAEVQRGGYLFCAPYFCIEGNVMKYVALPANYRGNVYVHQSKGCIVFSDDFFALCKAVRKVHFQFEHKQHLIHSASLPLGKTWVSEIECLIGHKVYYLEQGRLVSQDILIMDLGKKDDENELYGTFKENLNKVVSEYGGGKHALLLSGGADSRLLALVMNRQGLDFECYTAVMKPYYVSGVEDAEEAARVSRLIGKKNNLVDVNPKAFDIADIDEIIEKMPYAVHVSLPFIGLMSQVQKDGKNKVWAGQNADTLYNLGPSGRVTKNFTGFMNLYKRFCITEEFYRSFPEVSGYSGLRRKVNYAVAGLGCRQYNRMKKTGVKMPDTLEELVNNYLHSYDYTIFSEDGAEREVLLEQREYEPHEIKKIIYNYKVRNFLKSGAPVVIDTVSSLFGIEDYILPFSSELMLPVLQDVRLTTKNVFRPKKFIYRYIKEFEKDFGSGISKFDRTSLKLCRRKYGDLTDVHGAYEAIMKDTKIGRAIWGGRYDKKPAGWTGVQFMQTALSEYWAEKVLALLEEKYGVEVLNRNLV